MTLSEIITIFQAHDGLLLVGLALLSMIKIPKVELNVWSWAFRKIGNEMNHDMMKKTDSISEEVAMLKNRMDTHEARDAERDAKHARDKIIRFGDEILEGKRHSKDHFDTVILACGEYENYCKEHEEFQNDVTKDTICAIRDAYAKCWREKSFLM